MTLIKSEKTQAVERFKNATDHLCRSLALVDKDLTSGKKTPEATVSIISSLIQQSCDACTDAEAHVGDRVAELQEYLRDRIAPYFSRSWFMERAMTKPRGYPGDYKILEGIYDMNPKSQGLGKALDLYFIQSDLARAVRGRKDKCREIISDYIPHDTNGSLRVLDIASGPCREFHGSDNKSKLPPFHFVGIDNDEEALSYARKSIVNAGYDDSRFQFKKHNVLRLISGKRNVDTFGTFDLIYSVGLYDYLPDNVLLRVLQGSSAMLNEGGKYVVAFKDCHRYDKNEYQWHVDWHFFPRTEKECRKIVTDSGMQVVNTERDESGIIVFYTLSRIN